jgi:hypothetical protein
MFRSSTDARVETTDGAQVRRLGQRQCRVHGLLRKGAREQGRHRAAAAAAIQPQRPRGRPAEGGPSAVSEAVDGRPNGHGQTHAHRRSGSSSSSEPGGRGAEQSKLAPPPQYQPRPSHQHHGGGGHRHHSSLAEHGGGGHRGAHQASRQQYYQHHNAAPAPRARSASPQNNEPVGLCFTDQLGLHVARVHRCTRHGNLGCCVLPEESAEAGRAQVRRVGRAERRVGRAGLHGDVRESEAGPGSGQGRRAAPATGATAPSSGQPLLCQGKYAVIMLLPCPALPSLPPALFTIRTNNVLYVVVVVVVVVFSPNFKLKSATFFLCAQMFGCFRPTDRNRG